jgi:hypothetical protein
MSTVNTLIEEINTAIAGSLAYPKAKYWNQAYLQEKDGQSFPLINNGNLNGHKISLNDTYALQSYHRIISPETETDYTQGKGKYPYVIRVYTIRNVWLGNIKKLPQKTYETTDDVKNDVYLNFPVILSNKEIVKTNSENINKLEILSEEFEGVEFKHLSLDLVVFYIEYEIRQKIKCN